MELDTKLTMSLLANSVASEPQTAREDFVRFSSKMDVMIAKYTSPEDCKRDHGQDQSRNYCRPWNYADYLSRVATFRETHRWFAKPVHLSPPECSLKGWSCSETQMDTLVCTCCQAKVTFDKTEQTTTVSEAVQQQLSTGHSSECGWRALGGCDRSFLDLPGLPSERSLCAATLARAVSVVDALLPLAVKDAARAASRSTAVTVRFDSDAALSRGEAAPGKQLSQLKRALEAAIGCIQSGAPGPSKRGASAEDGLLTLLAVARAARRLLAGSPTADRADFPSRLMAAVLMIAVSGWQGAVREEGQNGTGASSSSRNSSSCLHCSLCSRSVSLAPGLPPPVVRSQQGEGSSLQGWELELDCAAQHRYFCPYVHGPALAPTWLDSGACSAMPGPSSRTEWKGWELSALALSRLHLSDGAVTADDRDVGREETAVSSEEEPVEPEQAYKRVRIVLDMVSA